MRRIFMGLLVLMGVIMLGCDKEIKEAVRPAAGTTAHGPPHEQDLSGRATSLESERT